MVNRNVIVELMRTGNLFSDMINTALQTRGLTIQQFNVLRILRGRNGLAACLESVTNDMIHRMSNTSRIVDKLTEKGYVIREVCKENRRKIDLFITSKGLAIIEEVDPLLIKKEQELTKTLSTIELEQLLQLLTKLKSKHKH